MKKYIIILIPVLFALNSCEDSLNFEVKDKVTLDNFFQTEDDAISSVNAIYDALGDVDLYCSSLWLVQDISSDDCDALSTWNDPNAHQLDRYTVQPTNNFLKNIWKSTYMLIARSNLAITRIPDVDMDDVLMNRLLGEARYLRALSYFNLARMFGDVPLILTPETDIDNYMVPRTNIDLVYEQIISDLGFAAENLPATYSGTSKGRVTRGAARGLLAKVYLTRQEWSLAAEQAGIVMDLADQGIYGLWDDFADNFKEAHKNGKESLFEVQFYKGVVAENNRIVISGLPSIYAFPAGVGIILPTEDLISNFEPGDHRYESTFFTEYDYFGHYVFDPHVWKHWDQDAYPPDKTGQSGADFPVMRYAEVLLIYAEALNEANSGPTPEAYDAVNQVRIRARNGDSLVLPELSGLSYQEFREAVWKEKRCETVNEGQRWFDLVRTGRLEERVIAAKGNKANPQPHNYVFPIPQRELDLNEYLEQNDNY